jgi:hypothetical protein
MSNVNKPIIVVTGATGAQGGSVVDYLLNDPEQSFQVRAITRNIESTKARGTLSFCHHYNRPFETTTSQLLLPEVSRWSRLTLMTFRVSKEHFRGLMASLALLTVSHRATCHGAC